MTLNQRDRLPLTCPTCERALAPIPDVSRVATGIYRRTCRYCREGGRVWHRWSIKVVPNEQERFVLWTQTFKAIGPVRYKRD